MDAERILTLLGLALRGGNLAVGEEPVEDAAQGCRARLILLARDAAPGTRRRAEAFARMGDCLLTETPFAKAELGRATGRTSAAVAALTDTGLAAAVGRRLAQLDPERYGSLAERLALKAKRAAERRETRKREPRPAPRPGSGPGKRPAPPKGGPPERGKRPPAAGKARPPEERRPSQRKKPTQWPAGQGADREKAAPRPSGRGRPKPRAKPYAHSRPVKKGKGSFRKREE